MNLTKLRHVIEVGRRSSFSKAAQALRISQSAVTKSVADVERRVGYAIFHRTSRGAVLTDPGREFVDRAARILVDAEQLFTESDAERDAVAGRLRLGVCPASFEWMLVEPLARFAGRHPTVVLEVVAGTVERITQLLVRGDVDVALGPRVVFDDRPGLDAEALGEVLTRLFVRRDHPLTRRPRVTTRDLAEFPFVATSFVHQVSQLLHAVYEEAGARPEQRINTVDYFPLVRRLVLATDAISIVESRHSQSRAFQSRFATLDVDVFPPIEISCATQRPWTPKRATSAWIEELRASRFLEPL